MSLQESVPTTMRRGTVEAKWTEAEDKVLRLLHPNYEAMANALRHRSKAACKGRCSVMGIATPHHVWTNKETTLLLKMWPTATMAELKAAFPFSTWTKIRKKATNDLDNGGLGLPKRPEPYVLTGDPCCDAIRDRCRELGYSMAYLDKIARTGNYFNQQRWRRTRGHSMHKMIKAIQALGGTFDVAWPD